MLRALAACAWVLGTLVPTPSIAQEVIANSGMKGAGSTFAQPVITRWSRLYREQQAGDAAAPRGFFGGTPAGLDSPLSTTQLDYEPVGSLGGMLRLKEGAVDFAASDVPLNSNELKRLGLAQFPIVVGGIIVAIHLDGVATGALKLTGPVMADIFLGKLTNWSDPAIAALNPGLALPDAKIAVVRRSDGSGTTANFTDYLSKTSAAWKQSVGSDLTVAWSTGIPARGNSGVARVVAATPNSIGYVEYSVAVQNKLAMASLQNRAGHFIAPSPAAFQATALQADWNESNDFDQSLIDKSGAGSYPIVATVYVLMSRRSTTRNTEAVIDFFRWSLDSGAKEASTLGYVPLPPQLVRQVGDYWTGIPRASR